MDLIGGNSAFDQIMKSQRTMDLILGKGSALESMSKSMRSFDLAKSSAIASIQDPMRAQLSQNSAFKSLLGPSIADITGVARYSSASAALVHGSKFASSNRFAELFSPTMLRSPAIDSLGSSVAKQIGENFASEILPRPTLRAFKEYERALIAARSAELIGDADSDLTLLDDSTTHSPLESPSAATDAALAVSGKLPLEEDQALHQQILKGIELLQMQIAELRAASETDRRRTDAQFFLQLMLVLLTYRFPPH